MSNFLTGRTLKSVLLPSFIFHVVDPSDPTDNAAGSSFKGLLYGLMALFEITKVSFEIEITAFLTGGQTGAYQLTKNKSQIDTCAVDGDSVKFLQAYPGLDQEIHNNSTKDVDVFPFLGDKFLGLAINEAKVLTPGQTMRIFAFKPLILTVL